ncbi:MFS transporter [Primorskyibacter sp. S187A]|uniref:MFS transporter n=1 Tax=Primorskyibacter sp. S187A TaxID=3415130 RepID=UPI003C7A2653
MISRDDIRAARATLAAFMVNGFAWGGFAGQVPLIKARIGAGDADFGLAMFVAAIGAVAAMWLAPRFDARFGARAMLVLALLLAGSFLLPGIVLSVWVFALAMMLCSATSGSLDVIMNARLSSIEAERKRPLMNFAHAMFSFAYAFAALVAGFAREAGWPPVLIFGFLGVLSCLLCYIVAQDRMRDSHGEDEGAARAPSALLWLGGVVILVAFMSEQATEGWSALHLERNLGAGAAEGAFGPAILGLTMGIGRMTGQAVVQRLAPLSVIAVTAAMSALGAFIAASASSLNMAYLGFALLGGGISVIAPMAYAYVGTRVSERARTHAIARISVIGYAGFFIGPPMMGLLAEAFGLAASFSVIGLCLAGVLLVFVPALYRYDRRQAHA